MACMVSVEFILYSWLDQNISWTNHWVIRRTLVYLLFQVREHWFSLHAGFEVFLTITITLLVLKPERFIVTSQMNIKCVIFYQIDYCVSSWCQVSVVTTWNHSRCCKFPLLPAEDELTSSGDGCSEEDKDTSTSTPPPVFETDDKHNPNHRFDADSHSPS